MRGIRIIMVLVCLSLGANNSSASHIICGGIFNGITLELDSFGWPIEARISRGYSDYTVENCIFLEEGIFKCTSMTEIKSANTKAMQRKRTVIIDIKEKPAYGQFTQEYEPNYLNINTKYTYDNCQY